MVFRKPDFTMLGGRVQAEELCRRAFSWAWMDSLTEMFGIRYMVHRCIQLLERTRISGFFHTFSRLHSDVCWMPCCTALLQGFSDPNPSIFRSEVRGVAAFSQAFASLGCEAR